MYSVDRYFQHKPVDKLFGRHISWKDFSDDALGTTLDRIYQYGVNDFYLNIAMEIFKTHPYLFDKFSNMDTSTLALSGKFKNQAGIQRPKHGHSKDHRPDLLQMVFSMAITGPAKIPFWMDVHSGNTSDKELLVKTLERIEEFQKYLFGSDHGGLHIADSALFSKKFVSKFCFKAKWVSRLSESYNIAKQLLKDSMTQDDWEKVGPYNSHFGAAEKPC